MGLILDASVLIPGERWGKSARQTLTELAQEVGDAEIGISVVTLAELAHGVARANSPERMSIRKRFLDELATAVPIYPVTATMALRAGDIDGQSQARGVKIPLADLLVGVAALELGYALGTANVRHFSMIPGLRVTKL